MQPDKQPEQSLLDAFVAALHEIPGADAQIQNLELCVGERHRIDAVVDAAISGKRLHLLVEIKGTAFPRDVREAVWQLRAYQGSPATNAQHSNTLPFILAETLSAGARETLRNEQVGYFDRSGSLYVPAKGAYIFIDKTPPRNKRRKLTTIFRGSKALVLHAVFAKHGDWVSVKEVAEMSGVSPATASQVLGELERRDWVEARGSGPAKMRRLIEPTKMLDAWTHQEQEEKAPSMRRYFVPNYHGLELVRRVAAALEAHHATYAITAEAAAQIYAPSVTSISQVRCRAVSGAAAREAVSSLGARPADQGWNVAIIERSPAEFSRVEHKNGISLATPLQTYLDLLQSSGRAKEMADRLRKEVLQA